MKLSDIKGERTLDVIADLIEPICNIAEDEQAAALFMPQELKAGENATQMFIKRVKVAAPKLLKSHREDLVMILATIKDVSVEEYTEAMTLGGVIADVVDLLSDEEFLAFLS